MTKLPRIHFANKHGKLIDASKFEDNDENDNDQPLKETPPEIIKMLGFDPLDNDASDVKNDKKPDLAKLVGVCPPEYSSSSVKVYDVSTRSELNAVTANAHGSLRGIIHHGKLYVWNAMHALHGDIANWLNVLSDYDRIYLHRYGSKFNIKYYKPSTPDRLRKNEVLKRLFTVDELERMPIVKAQDDGEYGEDEDGVCCINPDDIEEDDFAHLLDTAAKKPKPKYEVYKFTGGRGVALQTVKRGKTVEASLRKGDMFGVRPSAKGPDWAVIVLEKVGDYYSFTVPQSMLRRMLNASKIYIKESHAKATPSHLLSMLPVWTEAKPEGMGDKKTWPYFTISKWAAIHKGVNVKPADLVMACAHVEKGLNFTGLNLKDLKPAMMSVHRGLKAMLALFKVKLTTKQLAAVAAYIRKPSVEPAPKVLMLMSNHDARWRVDGKQYVKRRSKPTK
jgi:hypothetical protein